MRLVSILLKRELKELFFSPLYSIVAAFFILMIGIIFFNHLVSNRELTNVTVNAQIILPTFGTMNFLLMFVSCFMTMNLFVDEKRQNTLDLLLSSKLKIWHIVAAKFLVGFFSVISIATPTLVFPIVLGLSGSIDWGLVLSNYLGIILSVASFVAVGMFTSSLTENSIIAVISSFVILLSCLILLNSSLLIENSMLKMMMQYFSFGHHSGMLAQGALMSYSLVYFLSFVGFFIYLTFHAISLRKW